jgi:hypothetical protein
MNQGRNLYRADDTLQGNLPPGPKVFLSHRLPDKPIVRAIASLLSAFDVHYWLDEKDQDIQRATALGMVGDQALVHAIERGVLHSTNLLGLISPRTEGSWWVPYEIGYSRSASKAVSFLMLQDKERSVRLPEYARIAAAYWSVDELARWVAIIAGYSFDIHLNFIPTSVFNDLREYVPFHPPQLNIYALCKYALDAIELLAKKETQSALALTTDRFTWLPTRGGFIRDIAYDLLAPLALYRFTAHDLVAREQKLLEIAYHALTQDHEIAEYLPKLTYAPGVKEWKTLRYQTPKSTWLQGLSAEQLEDRLRRLFITPSIDGKARLVTKEEFKAQFDRILKGEGYSLDRCLGVLINPLFGFTPELRPVYWRILAVQYQLFVELTKADTRSNPFDWATRLVVQRYLRRQHN